MTPSEPPSRHPGAVGGSGVATPRAVFLDLDGCLVDSRAAISRCLNLGLAAVGASSRPPEQLYACIGPPLHESFVLLLAEEGLSGHLADRCVRAYRDAYREVSLTETRSVSGIDAAVARLAARTTLAVVTSKPADFARPILEAMGLARHVVAVHAPRLGVRAEPKAETLARALHEVVPGVAPQRTAMVGDRHHDVAAGRACGTATVGVTWGTGEPGELAAADVVIDHPEQLPAVLGT